MHDPASISIAPVRTAEALAAAVELFRAYAASLDVDLAYQDFDAEMAEMPGKYAPPSGELLLARDGAGNPLGCVALRPLGKDGVCEMKRLYVSPEGRGTGVGKKLVEAVVGEAERIGYREMRLDTLPSMTEATGLYRASGFEPIQPYYQTPVTGTLFLRRHLIGVAASDGS
jgi:ribosomal protein S18 acetylase RimI-like enzyme